VLKHLLELGVALVPSLAVVWYISPATTGGTVLLLVASTAVIKGIVELVRWMKGPESEQKVEVDGRNAATPVDAAKDKDDTG
jgi:hypothetical protein